MPLPFGWVHDGQDDERPYGCFSIHKPSWSPAESSVSFSVLASGDDPARIRARWMDMHKKMDTRLIPVRIGTDTKDALHGSGGQPLLCAETPMSRWILLDCIADDSNWHFQYFGDASDVKEADQTIRYLLSHESEFHPTAFLIPIP